MKKIFSVFFLCLTFSVFAQNTYNPAPQTWTINYESVACGNEKNGECLLIKFPGKKEYEIFSDNIEGFNYEKGYTYVITVKQELKQPPIAANESMFKYVLLKVVTKKSITPAPTVTPTTATPQSKIIFEVNYETVPCDENKNCLLIREKGKKEFEIFTAKIAGFNFQPGYSYTIEVKPTVDGNYYLANEISKKLIKPYSSDNSNTTPVINNTNGKVIATSNIQTNSNLDGKWYLRKMKEAEGSSFVMDDNVIWIDINTFKDRIDGFGACNKFATVVKSNQSTTFEVSKLTSNISICGNKKIEDAFFDLLQQADKFEIKNGNLILSKQWKYLLAFTSNPDNKEDIITTYVPDKIIQKANTTYATDDVSQIQNTIPKANSNSTTSTTTSTTTSLTPITAATTQNTKIDPELEAKNKEIEALKKQLAAQAKSDEAQKEAQLKAQKDAEIAALKKQLEDKQLKEAQQQKDAQLKAQKDAEIAALKKQLSEKPTQTTSTQITTKKTVVEEEEVETAKPVSKPSKISTKEANIAVETPKEENTKSNADVSDKYNITPFTKNKSNNIPDPEFTAQPYYLDGAELMRLERSKANFTAKVKGVFRGVDQQFQIMNEESPIQFSNDNLPRFFISIADDDVDPHDVIDLCRADKISVGRRNFTYAGRTYDGRVKNVTGKLAELDFKKIRKGVYEIIIDSELKQGEYAFIPMFKDEKGLSSSNSIRASCFGVVDAKNLNKK